MIVPPRRPGRVEFALPITALILVAGLVVGVVVAVRALHGFREQNNALMLGLAERLRPNAAVEQAHAAVIRDDAASERALAAALDAKIEKEREPYLDYIAAERKKGYPDDIAEARAVMVAAGLDPDDAAETAGWNQSH